MNIKLATNFNKIGFGMILGLVTFILFHLIHCGLPLILSIFLLLGLAPPKFLSGYTLPTSWSILLTLLFAVYIFFRKRIIFFWTKGKGMRRL